MIINAPWSFDSSISDITWEHPPESLCTVCNILYNVHLSGCPECFVSNQRYGIHYKKERHPSLPEHHTHTSPQGAP